MAITTVRSTYALDVETVRVLDRIAHRWGVSKSEALRRAIRGAEAQKPPAADDALRALDRLQRSLQLTPVKAKAWTARTWRERRASATRREARGR